MLGPGVHIYCADHHRNAGKRRAGIERAFPVHVGAEVWIGGGAILLPGVTVGDGAIIGAGAVVSRDIAAGSRVAGVPARGL
jgi:maltose O-acetyltransferase